MQIQIEFFAGFVSYDAVFESVDKGTAAQFQTRIVAGASFELLAVHVAFIIDVHDIAQLRRAAADFLRFDMAAQQGLDLALDLFLGNRYFGSRHLDAFVLAERDVVFCGDPFEVTVVADALAVRGRLSAGRTVAGTAIVIAAVLRAGCHAEYHSQRQQQR